MSGARASGIKAVKMDQTDAVIMSLYLEGMSQYEIVDDERVNLKTQSAVSKRIAKIRQYWREQAVQDMNEIMGRELERIDKVEAEAWRAWFASWDDIEVHVENFSNTEPYEDTDQDGRPVTMPGRIQTSRRDETRGRLPDPRYLQVVAWAVEQRMKIFGLAGMDTRAGASGEPFQIEVFHRLVEKAERGELYALPSPKGAAT